MVGELDVGMIVFEVVILGCVNGVLIYVVVGFVKGGVCLVVGKDFGIKLVKDLKGKKVGVIWGGIYEVLLDVELG